MNILGFPEDAKKAGRDEKTRRILAKPLIEITSALDRLEAIKEAGDLEEDRPEERTAEEETAEEERLDEEAEKEDRILKEVEEEGKKLAEPEEAEEKEEKKEGFFSRLFKRKKKEEGAEEEKEEGERDKAPEEEDRIEEAPPKPPVEEAGGIDEAEEGKAEEASLEEETGVRKPEKESEEGKRQLLREELRELDRRKEAAEKRIKEEDEELGVEEPEEGKKGFFGKLTESFTLKRLSEAKFEEIFFELELALLENNVAVEVIEKIKKDLKDRMVDRKLKRSQIESIVLSTLKDSLDEILSTEPVDMLKRIREKSEEKRPYVIVFVGINGSGKTTTIAKMAKYFMNNSLKIVMVASDTFRAAAIQQLEEHANRLGVKLIKHDYGSDPAAVAFDGIKYAESKGIDVVLIDTAGRLHSNTNLMDEMKKIIRVAKPDIKIFIGESITGNDCIEQAQKFNEAVDIDGIVLSKADVDEKGGAAISVSYVTGKPILFLGTGQTYDSLQKFDKGIVMSNLGLA
ncbi:signal recognition particle-docking protein FtsY [Candidatus Woesearchaeota archaeon]|nr:signal recognition particle-docking protein FtsY [Candidatus Woesearchaeota archaeon]